MTAEFQAQGILTHFDASGAAHMVNVSAKPNTPRMARARGVITMSSQTLRLIAQGQAGKGDVLGVARVAGIMAAKKTSEIIPLCHPIALTHVAVDFELQDNINNKENSKENKKDNAAFQPQNAAVICTVTAQTVHGTGVEMEAMMAVSAALLTIYDMCKAAEKGMEIGQIQLLEKIGGKSGHWQRDNQPV